MMDIAPLNLICILKVDIVYSKFMMKLTMVQNIIGRIHSFDIRQSSFIRHSTFVIIQSLSPLATCRNQSTMKLTPTVKKAMAPAGHSGVKIPNVIAPEFSRTIPPQSAVGG